MIKTFFLGALCLALLDVPEAQAGHEVEKNADETYHILPVGGEEVVDLDFVPEKATLRSSVLEVQPGPSKSSLKVVGLSVGKASFLVNNKAGQIFQRVKFHVIRLEQYQRLQSVRRLLKGIKGTKITFEGDNIVVDGTATHDDRERIEKIGKAYPELLDLVNEKEE